MTAVIFGLIAVVFIVSGLGGIMFIDHQFAKSVEGRIYAVKGRRVETDDPFVRKQFRKFYALRVAYAMFLLVMLIWVAGNVG
ncbi:hypothetical protein GCM10011316_01130 [Roseibium aquae]|uniref:Uncharacterized protein n=1 Tax=Roseibium aquae TaxID=1323746 RepID=A0A916T5N4_9HYPH|nr:endonuclease [Roseibium aquae]GGB32816.1 hypothetical protein GCM10011316_01130 [Roseibium aquae]